MSTTTLLGDWKISAPLQFIGPPTYMQFIIDQNVIMWHVTIDLRPKAIAISPGDEPWPRLLFKIILNKKGISKIENIHWFKAYIIALLYARCCVQKDMLDFKESIWHLDGPSQLIAIMATIIPLPVYRTLEYEVWLLPSRGRVYFPPSWMCIVPMSYFDK